MVNGDFLRGRHEREVKEFKYHRSYVHIIMIWKGWYWLSFNYRSWKHIKNPRGTKSNGSRVVKHRQSLWVGNFYMTCLSQIVYKQWTNISISFWPLNLYFYKLLLYETNAFRTWMYFHGFQIWICFEHEYSIVKHTWDLLEWLI